MSVAFKNYLVTAESNQYVSPYSYYITYQIPLEDITNKGVPVCASATTTGGIPVPCALYLDDGIYRVSIASSHAPIDIAVVFVDV